MRELKIVPEKDQYSAGQTVEGTMIVRCDGEFRCNAIHLTFTGREHTKIVESDGENSSTYRQERVYFRTKAEFETECVVAAGETRYPFQFRLPDDAPQSYSGANGWSEYSLDGVVEVSWAFDPREQTLIIVHDPAGKRVSHPRSESVDRDERLALEVELDRDSVCLGEPIALRFRVAGDVKIRGVRVELWAKEKASAEGHDAEEKRELVSQFIEEREVIRDAWMNTEIQTRESMPASFDGAIVKLETFVKVTLDVPWAVDTWVTIPVRLVRCADVSTSEIDDYFAHEWKPV